MGKESVMKTNDPHSWVHHITQPTDPVRVEIKENAKGEPQVAVRMTGWDTERVKRQALDLYNETKQALTGEAPSE